MAAKFRLAKYHNLQRAMEVDHEYVMVKNRLSIGIVMPGMVPYMVI